MRPRAAAICFTIWGRSASKDAKARYECTRWIGNASCKRLRPRAPRHNDDPMETADKLRLRFWGVRGSTPSPGKDKLVYGGNTPCVEIRTASNQVLVFDGGSGIRDLGRQLVAEFAGQNLSLNLFLTH